MGFDFAPQVCGKTRVCTEAYGAAVEDIGQNVDETLQVREYDVVLFWTNIQLLQQVD